MSSVNTHASSHNRRELAHGYLLDSMLPADLVQSTLTLTDQLLAQADSESDYSSRLAGRFARGRQVIIPRRECQLDRPFARFLIAMCEDYVAQFFNDIAATRGTNQEWVLPGDPRELTDRTSFDINDMWVVSQFAGDYNPPHRHFGRSPCMLSGVAYLMVPPAVREGDFDGAIRFAWGSRVMFDLANFSRPEHWVISPQVGQVLLFPSNLVHEVFPIKGDLERRSVAFNVNVWCNAFPFLSEGVKSEGVKS